MTESGVQRLYSGPEIEGLPSVDSSQSPGSCPPSKCSRPEQLVESMGNPTETQKLGYFYGTVSRNCDTTLKDNDIAQQRAHEVSRRTYSLRKKR